MPAAWEKRRSQHTAGLRNSCCFVVVRAYGVPLLVLQFF